MEWGLIRTLAGFMNAYGGTLLVGVDDSGSLVGIQEDFPLLKKPDCDGWELWLTDAVSRSLGSPAAAELDVSIGRLDGRFVARVDAGPAAKPIFATPPGPNGKPAFVVRINNATHELAGPEAHDYQKARWPG